ncbi:MAG: radical SAM protein [Deltaproteobacteria bacterium]|nr:radical SAM protein [Deltaproteobacteria bacterium]
MPLADGPALLKVALVNPPYLGRYSRSQRSPGVITSGTMYYPYWLAHAAAVLDAAGHDIALYDCPAADIDAADLYRRLDAYQPDLCILESSTASSANDCAVAAEIKRRRPQTQVCMVGTHVTALWRETLDAHAAIDFVAIGEYDYIVRDLAAALRAGDRAALPSIGGLAFRADDGQPARGPVRPPIDDVDALPWIAPIYQRFLDPKNYYFSLASHPMVMLIGGRGCVAKCTYCVYPQVMHGHRYRTRSPASIVGEMKWVQEHMPEVREVVFEDDTFTGDREFAKEVARLVKEQGVRLPWFANVRTNVDRETLAHMVEAGFRCCATGFESGDALLLKNMWKGQSLEQAKRFVDDARALGVLVHGCFMVGFPGETRETMEKTLALALHLQPDSAQFYPVMPFPGTTYYEWARAHGYLASERFADWLDSDGAHRAVLNLPGLSAAEIDAFCARAYRRFYLRPGYVWFKARQALRHPREGVRSLGASLNALRALFTRRARRAPFAAVPVAVPADWYTRHELPKGRMFRQWDALRRHAGSDADAAALEDLARRAPDI